ATSPLSPYVSLRPFEEGDAALFFGREELVPELLARLTKSSPFAEVVDGIGEGLGIGGRAVLGVRGHDVDRLRFPASAPGAPPAFHLLAKPTGAVCNLDCSYCFFLSKEMLYPGSRFRMADELLDAYLRQLIEAHARAPEVVVAWQGGEPTLMGLDFFRRSVELAERYLRPGQRAVYTIQTNGTLLDEEWAAFFKEHDFLVGISIDGPRGLHDAYRVNKGRQGHFHTVIRGLD